MKGRIKVVGIIPARGGSRRIAKKNMVALCGQPLLTYTLAAAVGSKFIDHVIVSSDDKAILGCARDFFKERGILVGQQEQRGGGGAPGEQTSGAVLPTGELQERPAALSGDKTLMEEVLHYILKPLVTSWQYFILLQPTSPLRTEKHIDAALRLLEREATEAIIGVRPVARAAYKYFQQQRDGTLAGLVNNSAPFSNAQASPVLFAATGAIYIASVREFVRNGSFPLKQARPYIMEASVALDIDTRADIRRAELLLAAKV